MSTTISYTYTDSTNYTYSSTSLIDISSGVAVLTLINATGLNYEEDFSSTVGFIYPSSYSTVSGGQIEQVSLRPTDAIAYASFDVDENLSWGEGTLTGTLGGSASVSGGELDLTGGNANVEYPVDNLATMVQQGCVRIRLKPNYTGAAPAVQDLFQSSPNTNDRLLIRHSGTTLQVYGFCGAAQIMSMTATWSPTAGAYYEIEVNFNFTSGTHRLLLDGIVQDTETAKTGTRGGNTLCRFGSGSGMDLYIEAAAIFDAVQHTANYTPDWTNFYETDYQASLNQLPIFETPNPGTIQSIESFTVTESGTPRYTVGISTVYQFYWTGSSWAVSNLTYTQASPSSDVIDNLISLFGSGVSAVYIFTLFTSTNTQGNVSDIQMEYTGQKYSTETPYIETVTSFRTDGLVSFDDTFVSTGSDMVKHTLSKASTHYYYDSTGSSAWSTATGIYAETNRSSDINTYSTSFISDNMGYDITVRSFLYSDDGLTTPELSQVDATFSLVGVPPTMVSHTYYGSLKKIDNSNLEGKTIAVRADYSRNANVLLTDDYITTTVRADGYWEIDIYYEDVQPDKLYWYIDNKKYITNFSTATNVFEELRVSRG